VYERWGESAFCTPYHSLATQYPSGGAKAASSVNAFHMNEFLNGVPVSGLVHASNHGIYNDKVFAKLEEIRRDFPNISPELARQKLEPLIHSIRTAIQNNSGAGIGSINF
jgi:hypothetical protein